MADGFPSWRYGPDGQSAVFDNPDDVPAGWKEHPSQAAKVSAAEPSSPAPPPSLPKKPARRKVKRRGNSN